MSNFFTSFQFVGGVNYTFVVLTRKLQTSPFGFNIALYDETLRSAFRTSDIYQVGSTGQYTTLQISSYYSGTFFFLDSEDYNVQPDSPVGYTVWVKCPLYHTLVGNACRLNCDLVPYPNSVTANPSTPAFVFTPTSAEMCFRISCDTTPYPGFWTIRRAFVNDDATTHPQPFQFRKTIAFVGQLYQFVHTAIFGTCIVQYSN